MSDVNAQMQEYAAYRDFLNAIAAQHQLDPTRGLFGEAVVGGPPTADPAAIAQAQEYNQRAASVRDFLNSVAAQQSNPAADYEPSDYASGPGEVIDYWKPKAPLPPSPVATPVPGWMAPEPPSMTNAPAPAQPQRTTTRTTVPRR